MALPPPNPPVEGQAARDFRAKLGRTRAPPAVRDLYRDARKAYQAKRTD